jgi:Uma2 family endonuclease
VRITLLLAICSSTTVALKRGIGTSEDPISIVVLGVDGTADRQGWVVWEENGRYPDVIVELMSPSTPQVDTGVKKDIYEQTFRTPDYFVFDPFDPNSLRGGAWI